ERERDVVDVDLVLADEMQQQVERALECLDAHRIALESRLVLLGRGGHGSSQYCRCMAARTRAMVSMAMARAFFEPSCMISRTRSGCASYCARRSRIGSRYALSAFESFFFTSTSPTRPSR